MDIALLFAHAVYVREWDGVPEAFEFASRHADGSYILKRPGWDSSKAFNKLARSGWKLYFNHIGVDAIRLQDTQILTGSKVNLNSKLTVVVAFRGSDNIFDYLFTNCKNNPVSLTQLQMTGNSELEDFNLIWDQYTVPSITVMTCNVMTTWLSNRVSKAPILVHKGYMEQVACGLNAKVVDPVNGDLLSVKDMVNKYPDAEFVIAGHSSGGGAAQILSTLLYEKGIGRQNIHLRTFATAGAFNYRGQAKYRDIDSINYFIVGDPIQIVNDLTGFGPLGVSIMVSPTHRFSQNSRTVHEMTAYEEQLSNN
ncbi:lipase family protein [Sporomusa acidovorans]|nr:hypothetical protein [Sporomusa acidovorans]